MSAIRGKPSPWNGFLRARGMSPFQFGALALPEREALKREYRERGRTPSAVETSPETPAAEAEAEAAPGTPETQATPGQPSWRDVARLAEEEDQHGGGSVALGPVALLFDALFGLIALGCGDHWALSPKESRDLSRAWVAWIASLPKRQGAFLKKITREIAPTLTFASVLISIIGRRVQRPRRQAAGNAPAPLSMPAAAEAARNGQGPAPALDPRFLGEPAA